MSPEHRAIIALAEKEGLSPCEKDARLVVHDMVNTTRKAMQKYEVGYNKMTEKQQDAVLGDLEAAFKDLALTVARTIASGGTPAISMTLKDMKISNGTVTGIVDGSDKHFNDLISKVQDKSEVMVVLYERQYADAMDAIQSDKDQKPLALGEPGENVSDPTKEKTKSSGSPTSAKALAAKSIELPEKLVADAVEFVKRNQVCTTAGLQNGLKIATKKAEAVQLKLADLGHIALDDEGVYQIVRTAANPGDGASSGKDSLSFDGDLPTPTGLTDELYADIKAKVVLDGRVSVGALAVAFDLGTDLAEDAIVRLEADGYVSPEDEETGARSVLIKQD